MIPRVEVGPQLVSDEIIGMGHISLGCDLSWDLVESLDLTLR